MTEAIEHAVAHLRLGGFGSVTSLEVSERELESLKDERFRLLTVTEIPHGAPCVVNTCNGPLTVKAKP